MNIFNGNTKDFEEYARAGVVEGNYNERQLKYYNWLNGFNSRSLTAAIRSANKSRVAEVFNLFANGEQGAWYDPSDLSTLYQDAAGTTPVQNDGDPVGLMLDKSKGLVRGSELVSNGTFDTDTGWIKGSGWTISGGQANYSGTGVAAGLNQTISLTAGTSYEITGTADITSGLFIIRLTGGSTVTGPSIDAGGQFRAVLTAEAGNTDIQFFGSSSGVFSIDNVGVKALPGNHATQPTSGNKPLYRTDGALHWLEADGFDDNIQTPVFVSASHSAVVAFLPDANDRSILTSGASRDAPTLQDFDIFGAATESRYRTVDSLDSINYQLVSSPFSVGTEFIVSVSWDGTTNENQVVYRVNGLETTGTSSSAEISQDNPLTIMGNGSFIFDGRFYGLVINESSQIPRTELNTVEKYFAEKIGMVL